MFSNVFGTNVPCLDITDDRRSGRKTQTNRPTWYPGRAGKIGSPRHAAACLATESSAAAATCGKSSQRQQAQRSRGRLGHVQTSDGDNGAHIAAGSSAVAHAHTATAATHGSAGFGVCHKLSGTLAFRQLAQPAILRKEHTGPFLVN